MGQNRGPIELQEIKKITNRRWLTLGRSQAVPAHRFPYGEEQPGSQKPRETDNKEYGLPWAHIPHKRQGYDINTLKLRNHERTNHEGEPDTKKRTCGIET